MLLELEGKNSRIMAQDAEIAQVAAKSAAVEMQLATLQNEAQSYLQQLRRDHVLGKAYEESIAGLRMALEQSESGASRSRQQLEDVLRQLNQSKSAFSEAEAKIFQSTNR
jgi:chromosome segregation ATPase